MKVGINPGTIDLEEKGDHHVEKRQRQDPCMTSPGMPQVGQQPPETKRDA